MDPNTLDLYAGLAGFALEPERFELGQGTVISRTYAHLMAPFMMAFSPASPGKPHPTPWRAAKGGLGIDIYAELYIPTSCRLDCIDRLNSVWWICALLRLRATTRAYVPVLSSEKFCSITAIKEEPILWPVEIHMSRLFPDGTKESAKIGTEQLEWVACHWQDASTLLRNEDFNFAFQAVDSSIWSSNSSLALLAVWGALERLFSPATQELRFRVSANIASFLEPPGRDRYKCFKLLQSLYDSRSKAAHGDSHSELVYYAESLAVAQRVLIRMIETKHVPTKKSLESHLFGDDLGISESVSDQ